jgi:hypothetical protein
MIACNGQSGSDTRKRVMFGNSPRKHLFQLMLYCRYLAGTTRSNNNVDFINSAICLKQNGAQDIIDLLKHTSQHRFKMLPAATPLNTSGPIRTVTCLPRIES